MLSIVLAWIEHVLRSYKHVNRQILNHGLVHQFFHQNMDVFVEWLSMPASLQNFHLAAMVDETLARYACWISSQASSDPSGDCAWLGMALIQLHLSAHRHHLPPAWNKNCSVLRSSCCPRHVNAHIVAYLTGRKSQNAFVKTIMYIISTKMLPKEWHVQSDLVRSPKLRKSLDKHCTCST